MVRLIFTWPHELFTTCFRFRGIFNPASSGCAIFSSTDAFGSTHQHTAPRRLREGDVVSIQTDLVNASVRIAVFGAEESAPTNRFGFYFGLGANITDPVGRTLYAAGPRGSPGDFVAGVTFGN